MDTTDTPNIYRTFFLKSTEAMILAKRDGAILSANPAACALFQFSEAELKDKGFSQLFVPGNSPMCSLSDKSKTTGNLHDEFVFLKRDGTPFLGSVNAEIFTQNGTEPFSMVVIRDLTDRDITQRKDRETTAFLNSIVNSTNDLIWSVDVETFGLLFFNRNMETYFLKHRGIQIQKGMRPQDLYLDEKFIETWNNLYQMALKEGPYVTKYTGIAGPVIMEMTFNLLKHNDKVYAISVFGKDITEEILAQKRVGKLSRLYDTRSQVNTAVVRSENRDDLFGNICKAVVEHGNFLMAWVGLIDEATHRVFPVCHAGNEQGYLTNIHISTEDIPQGRGPTGTSIREDRICFVNNFLTDERIKPWQTEGARCGFKSSAAVPLKQEDRIIGALTIYSGEHDFFDSELQALMEEMASDISFALDKLVSETKRHAAEEKIARYLKQLESSMEGTLLAVANMVELRDPYTAGHERRVGIIAERIAQELGWEEESCMGLQRIGLVHDIGKIAIPAEILVKPTQLTVFEAEMIKTHAQKGYEILKDIEFPFPIAETIYQHHERMDGSGYPRGLSNDEILPEARIIAVSDVLEAMASHRPYRPSLGIDAALEEIERGRGKLYDCSVVDAALRLFREKGYRIPQ